MTPVVSIKNLNKKYDDGHVALKDINLDIREGEIFALLGPNGAGKTTLINSICGLVKITDGSISVKGHDVTSEFKKARAEIGLVPQELTVNMFEPVGSTVAFSRGLFGKPKNNELIKQLLKDLSLWDKKDSTLITLSGGMKRRVMIAKALSHEPRILFLDEPTAGVDVELRKDMWNLVRRLKESGVTIILTTHYLEEAEEMADRIGVISKGSLIVVDDKDTIMKKLGKKQLILEVDGQNYKTPSQLEKYDISQNEDFVTITYGANQGELTIRDLIKDINDSGLEYKDLQTKESSLEEIFVELVKD